LDGSCLIEILETGDVAPSAIGWGKSTTVRAI